MIDDDQNMQDSYRKLESNRNTLDSKQHPARARQAETWRFLKYSKSYSNELELFFLYALCTAL